MIPDFQRVDLETNHDAVLLEAGLASRKRLLEKEPKERSQGDPGQFSVEQGGLLHSHSHKCHSSLNRETALTVAATSTKISAPNAWTEVFTDNSVQFS